MDRDIKTTPSELCALWVAYFAGMILGGCLLGNWAIVAPTSWGAATALLLVWRPWSAPVAAKCGVKPEGEA